MFVLKDFDVCPEAFAALGSPRSDQHFRSKLERMHRDLQLKVQQVKENL